MHAREGESKTANNDMITRHVLQCTLVRGVLSQSEYKTETSITVLETREKENKIEQEFVEKLNNIFQ